MFKKKKYKGKSPLAQFYKAVKLAKYKQGTGCINVNLIAFWQVKYLSALWNQNNAYLSLFGLMAWLCSLTPFYIQCNFFAEIEDNITSELYTPCADLQNFYC